MRYFDGFNIERAESSTDLKYSEYMCVQCKKIIQQNEVVQRNNGRIYKNGINFCSKSCKRENEKSYDRIVT